MPEAVAITPDVEPTSTALTLEDLNIVGEEPRLRDTRLGEILGMAQPLNIRGTVEQNREELEGFGPIHAVREMVMVGSGARRLVTSFFLNEAQALLLCMFSRTAIAAQVRKSLIDVFMAWRRGSLPEPVKVVTVHSHKRRVSTSREVAVRLDKIAERLETLLPMAPDLLSQMGGEARVKDGRYIIAVKDGAIRHFEDVGKRALVDGYDRSSLNRFILEHVSWELLPNLMETSADTLARAAQRVCERPIDVIPIGKRATY